MASASSPTAYRHHSSWPVMSMLIVAALDNSLVSSLSFSNHFSRRKLIERTLFIASGGITCIGLDQNRVPAPANAAAELPLAVRDYTKLAPLGPEGADQDNSKKRNLDLAQIAQQLTRDLTTGSTGHGPYIISGDLGGEIFRNDCIFVDPTNRVASLSQYKKALTLLFDTERSVVELLGPLQIDEANNYIHGKFRSRGFLKLPWNPYVSAYESNVVYKVGADDGLIYEQSQTWSKSSYEALRESFTPTIYTPAPASKQLSAPDSEPRKVSLLFNKVNGRRPGEYSTLEQYEIRQLMTDIVNQEQESSNIWNPHLFPGTWKLVYFEGGGVDRRVPFPELGFNDQYQIFVDNDGARSVTNIGELVGPSLFVQVLGTYRQVDDSSRSSPKRLEATIERGELCVGSHMASEGSTPTNKCVKLPIQGVGLFESLYLGPRLRLLQNLNGTGARGIQVRMS